MAVYLISYDLDKPGQNYSKVHEAIKSYGSWAKVLESTWLIETTQTAGQVRDNILRSMDENDKLFVLRAGSEAGWYNLPEDVSRWIKEKLK
ncbi:CRISPR-associated protein Cas2 [Brevibacillus centrosporus]|uniref:CRISPR-associated protein Cas2 n=1 Tax=Brevibacillus centrosporus TaxID=54910 RepID=UPI003B018A2C